MILFNLGSINIDHFYQVPHIPAAGETLAATAHRTGLGGKGANQSVSAALAGAQVVHIGAVGPDAGNILDPLIAAGVDLGHVALSDQPTAHANICVDPDGENMIVIYSGANLTQEKGRIAAALDGAGPGDCLLLQNETNCQAEAAQLARERGVLVVYSAAPFSVEAAAEMLPITDILVMNEVEEAQLTAALGAVDGPELIVTHGAKGASWRWAGGQEFQPAFPVDPVDTTGAGDCFIGSVMALRDQGAGRAEALRYAAAAAALQVTRPGTAQAMPDRAEVEALLAKA